MTAACRCKFAEAAEGCLVQRAVDANVAWPAYVIMADIVMADIVMADVVTANIVVADIVMADTGAAWAC